MEKNVFNTNHLAENKTQIKQVSDLWLLNKMFIIFIYLVHVKFNSTLIRQFIL